MISNYFKDMENRIQKIFEVAKKARSKGKDPELVPEVEIAQDKNHRSVQLLSLIYPQVSEVKEEIVGRILELEEKYGYGDDRVALQIALELAQQKFCKFDSLEQAIDAGLRLGCAYNVKGVVAAPIEGIIKVSIDPKDKFLSVYYAGPIRTAGGTAQVFTLFIADYLRINFGLNRYIATEEEIERYYTEISDYITYVTRKQYKPDKEEVEFLVKNVPICITGEPTEKIEVSAFKDLPRVETNFIRGGMCLIYLDGLPLKAEKLWKKIKKYGKEFGLYESWKWLEEFINLKKSKKAEGDSGYLGEVPAGRPVYSLPKKGGFRLRYGRARNTGYGCFGFHPNTLYLLGKFPANASQMKIELPGKSCTVAPVTSISGPFVKLEDGSCIWLSNRKIAKYLDKIDEILFLGDILISYGDFSENNEKLIPSPWVEEWWVQEFQDFKEKENILSRERIEEILKEPLAISWEEAIKLARKGLPLHPRFTPFFDGFSKDELLEFIEYIKEGEVKGEKLILKKDERKRVLEKAFIEHLVSEDKVITDAWLKEFVEYLDEEKIKASDKEGFELVSEASKIEIRPVATRYIGARMGRPEKANLRKMKGSPQVLFPVGQEGGKMRNLVEVKSLVTDVSIFLCEKHGFSIYPFCPLCNSHLKNPKISRRRVNVQAMLEKAYEDLKEQKLPIIKGVRGVTSKNKVPEPIEKGILRAKYNLHVFRDGTVRFDLVNQPLTHFKPKEIGVSIEKLKELGYTKDIYGRDLENDNQILELFPQDIIISENCAKAFINISKFVDDLLVKFYGLEPFYNINSKEDLIGHVVFELAPHTIAPVACRIIGFTKNFCHYAQPYLFAATRRDVDGEENALILGLDCLLNFSKEYIPAKRGSVSDTPLLLTTKIDLKEVDDEVYDLDIAFRYPKEFYEKTWEMVSPAEVKIEQVKDRVGKKDALYNYGFTFDTDNINLGVHISSYKIIPEMKDKVKAQLSLAMKIKAVDEVLVADKILNTHLLKDIKGNFRKFFKQNFRCTNCNEIYRRLPLKGRCIKCGGNIVLTVSEGTVTKYLEISRFIANNFEVSPYTRQSLDIIEKNLERVFGRKSRQMSLAGFS